MGSSCRSAILSVFANYPELLWPSQEAPPPDCALSLALAALRRELLSRPRNCAPFSTFAINHLEKQFEPGAEGGPYPIQHLLLNSILHNFEITVIILPFFFFLRIYNQCNSHHLFLESKEHKIQKRNSAIRMLQMLFHDGMEGDYGSVKEL